MIGTAVIGAGRWGTNLIRNVRDSQELELVAVADTKPEALHSLQAAYVTGNPRTVLQDANIEAVVIATPPRSHCRLVQQALAAGKHVLCEKPLAMSSDECKTLGTLADEAGLCLMVDCTPVYLDEVQRANTQIDWDSVEEVRCLRTSRRIPRDAREVLWDLAPHDLAVLHFWMNTLPASWKITEEPAGLLRLEAEPNGGPKLNIVCGHSPTPAREIAVIANSGTHRLPQQQTSPEPLQQVIAHFARCIRDGALPLTDAHGAAETADILTAATDSLPH